MLTPNSYGEKSVGGYAWSVRCECGEGCNDAWSARCSHPRDKERRETFSFMHWIDERQPGWLDANVEAHVAIAGTTLGVPKAITAVLSGV